MGGKGFTMTSQACSPALGPRLWQPLRDETLFPLPGTLGLDRNETETISDYVLPSRCLLSEDLDFPCLEDRVTRFEVHGMRSKAVLPGAQLPGSMIAKRGMCPLVVRIVNSTLHFLLATCNP